MALKGVKGPDRVLYALSALLQNRLPGTIARYNESEKCEILLVVPENAATFGDAVKLSFQITGEQAAREISFPAGTYTLAGIINTINNAKTPLVASLFGDNGILLSAPASVKFNSEFFNLKQGQIVNYIPLQMPNSFIISGVLPAEKDIKAYPSVVIELQSISPESDGLMVTYGVALTVGVTASLNTSQSEYLSTVLMKYYDCFRDILIEQDDGSLGGIANGVNIFSGSIAEATGLQYFLKFLTVTLEISVEED